MSYYGRIEVIAGGMFSGKSEELIRRVRRSQIAGQEVKVLKPAIDDRYAKAEVVSHIKSSVSCEAVESAADIYRAVSRTDQVVAIDEAQFFDTTLVSVVTELANRGKRVILAGLDMDSEGNPFGTMPTLMAVAEDVTKLHAVCVQCGQDASFSYYKGTKGSQVEVGAAQYEARCRACWSMTRMNDQKTQLTQGQAAYEAYRNAVHFQSLPAWEAMSMDLRAGWEAAASAANASSDNPQSIRDWQTAIHEYAKDKGWWDSERSFGDLCSLFHSEITEAYEEYRNGHEVTETYFNDAKPEKPEGVPTELADVVIRILDFCGYAGIDLQEIIEQKHSYNLTRAYRHGGKRV